MVHNLATSKADKVEVHETRTKLALQMQDKSDQAEVTATLSNFTSDNTQRLLDLRSEVFNRLTESLA
jgi:GTP-binding protein EngB required for normal cell division